MLLCLIIRHNKISFLHLILFNNTFDILYCELIINIQKIIFPRTPTYYLGLATLGLTHAQSTVTWVITIVWRQIFGGTKLDLSRQLGSHHKVLPCTRLCSHVHQKLQCHGIPHYFCYWKKSKPNKNWESSEEDVKNSIASSKLSLASFSQVQRDLNLSTIVHIGVCKTRVTGWTWQPSPRN